MPRHLPLAAGDPQPWYGDIGNIEEVSRRLRCRPFAWFLHRFRGVYITGGILVTHKARCDFGGDATAFWVGFSLACASCWFIKMLSVVIQHKIIGERLGKMVSVRTLIARNSDTTRGMGFILSRKGLDLTVHVSASRSDHPSTGSALATGRTRV